MTFKKVYKTIYQRRYTHLKKHMNKKSFTNYVIDFRNDGVFREPLFRYHSSYKHKNKKIFIGLSSHYDMVHLDDAVKRATQLGLLVYQCNIPKPYKIYRTYIVLYEDGMPMDELRQFMLDFDPSHGTRPRSSS